MARAVIIEAMAAVPPTDFVLSRKICIKGNPVGL
jgi:hypothetical protein